MTPVLMHLVTTLRASSYRVTTRAKVANAMTTS